MFQKINLQYKCCTFKKLFIVIFWEIETPNDQISIAMMIHLTDALADQRMCSTALFGTYKYQYLSHSLLKCTNNTCWTMFSLYLHQYTSTELPVNIMMLFQFLILVTVSNVLSVLLLTFQLYIRQVILSVCFPDKLNVKGTLHASPVKLVQLNIGGN